MENHDNNASKTFYNHSKEENCHCLENIQWTWDPDNKSAGADIGIDHLEVRFNQNEMEDSVVARCTEPMSENQYYWEVKLSYPVYGTNFMIGVGTNEVNLTVLKDKYYLERLGMDAQTWGLSRFGLFHHNGERAFYSSRIDKLGAVIGFHLDLWRGTLSFYKNRKYLGLATSELKGKTLYAMASNGGHPTGMRIVHASSFPSSLQFFCAQKLRQLIPENENVLDVIDIPRGLKRFLRNNLSWLLDNVDKNMKPFCKIHDSLTKDVKAEYPLAYLITTYFLSNLDRSPLVKRRNFPVQDCKFYFSDDNTSNSSESESDD